MKSEQGLRFEPLFFRQKSIAENCSSTEHGVLCKLVISERKAPPFTAAPGARTIVCGMRPVITDAQPIGGLRKIRNSPITGRIDQLKPRTFPAFRPFSLLRIPAGNGKIRHISPLRQPAAEERT